MEPSVKKRYTAHEDEHGMITFYTDEVMSEAKQRIEEGAVFHKKHPNDPYIFKELSRTIEEQRIRYNDFIKLLPPFFTRYDEYYYYDKKVNDAFAFGADYFCKFIMYVDDEIITYLSLAFGTGKTDKTDLLVESLVNIGKRYNLILVDMYWNVVITLKNKKEVEDYILDRVKHTKRIQKEIEAMLKKKR